MEQQKKTQISLRGQSKLSNLTFLMAEVSEFTSFASQFEFKVTCGEFKARVKGSVSEGKLTNVKYFSKGPDYGLVLMETLLSFSSGKDQKALGLLTIREIENFLRDTNDVPAFDPAVDLECFSSVLKEFLAVLYRSHGQIKVFSYDPSRQGPFYQLSLVDKIKAVESILEEKIRPSLKNDDGSVELLDIDDLTVTISYGGSCSPSSTAGTLDFIKNTLAQETKETRLNIIVES